MASKKNKKTLMDAMAVKSPDKAASQEQINSPSYQLAYQDLNFLKRRALRPQRIGLEFMKTDMALHEKAIKSTVVIFGGARIPAPGQEAWAAYNEEQKNNLQKLAHFYDEARRFAQICSRFAATRSYKEFVIATGGGPGIMEAGNRGAADVKAPSIGFNIVLPHEQAPNQYISPELCFRFHYFAIRKMHLIQRAKALLAFPGGFGTMDELFEVLTLVQTGRMQAVPIILFGKDFWQKAFNTSFLEQQGMISPNSDKLFTYADTAEEAWKAITTFYEIEGDFSQ